MTATMRKGWLWIGVVTVVFLVLAYAWIDGGREPLRTITEPVALPELPRGSAR